MNLVSVDGLRFDLDPALWPPSTLSPICGGTFELAERRACKRLLKAGDRVVEFGTAIGLVSLMAARIVGPGLVTSFEANRLLVPVARRAARLNRLDVSVRHAAVIASGAARTRFYRAAEFARSSTLPMEGSEDVDVPAVRASDALAELRPNVLIVDVEGGEAALAEQIAGGGADTLIIEMHPYAIGLAGCEEVGRTLTDLGYGVRDDICDGQVACFERGLSRPFAASVVPPMLAAISAADGETRIEALAEAKARSPSNPAARARLARMLLQAQRWAEARDEADSLSALAPDMFEGPVLAARARRKLERFDEAAALIDQALRIAPGIAEVWQEAADVAAAAGDRARAFAFADELVRTNPFGFGGWLRRAKLALGLRRPQDALDSISQAMALKPADPQGLALEAKIRERFGPRH